MKKSDLYIWGLLGKLLPQAIFLVTNIILARFLTPADFGTIGVLSIFMMIATTLTEAGLGGSLIKEQNITELDKSTIFVYNIVVSAVAYVILFICAPNVEAYFGIPHLKIIMRVLCFVFIISAWGLISQTLLFKELRIRSLTLASTISVIVSSILSIIMAIRGCGVWSLVVYQVTQATIYTAIIIVVCRWRFSFKFSKESFKKLFSFGFFTTINNLVETAYENLLSFLFGRYLGVSQTGYLTQAKKIETASSSVLVSSINSVAFPLLAKLNEDKKAFLIEGQKLLKSISVLILPLFVFIAAYSEIIIMVLFGEEWRPASIYLRLLMFVGCFLVLDNTTRNFLKSLGCVKQMFVTTIIKRTLGLLLIISSIYINVNMLIYMYLIGSIIGFLCNWCIYLYLIKESIWIESLRLIRVCLIPTFCYVIFLVSENFLSGYLYYLIPSVILITYYLFIVRMLGYNLLSIVRGFIHI